jgi:hypothetical protein
MKRRAFSAGAWVWFHIERAVSASVSRHINRPIFNVSVSKKRLKADEGCGLIF